MAQELAVRLQVLSAARLALKTLAPGGSKLYTRPVDTPLRHSALDTVNPCGFNQCRVYDRNTSVNHHYVRSARISRNEEFWSGPRHHCAFPIHHREFWSEYSKHFWRKHFTLRFDVRAGAERCVQ